jgi:hypothetical protein
MEVVAMCEELSLYHSVPEEFTSLKEYTWRELNSLAFTSGSTYISFADGACPEEYTHDGANTTVTLKNIGAKKSLTISDIMHSATIAAAGYNGINSLLGAQQASLGIAGNMDPGSFVRASVMDVKAKEIRLAMTLVLNGCEGKYCNEQP